MNNQFGQPQGAGYSGRRLQQFGTDTNSNKNLGADDSNARAGGFGTRAPPQSRRQFPDPQQQQQQQRAGSTSKQAPADQDQGTNGTGPQPSDIVDIWKIAEEKEAGQGTRSQERTAVFIGESGSGKSTLIQLLKSNAQGTEEKPKATSAIEYTFVRRTNVNRKELLNCYEVAGGRQLTEMSYTPFSVCKSAAQLREAVFVIVVDLTAAISIIDAVEYWIRAVRAHSDKLLTEVFRSSPLEMETFTREQIARFQMHEDQQRVKPVPLTTVIVGTKYDLFEKFDSEKRKWIARALRLLAHQCGASLFFSTNQNLQQAGQFVTVFNRVIFQAPGKEVQALQLDHMKPIQVVSPLDKMAAISMQVQTKIVSTVQDFQKILTEKFTAEQAAQKQPGGEEKQEKKTLLDLMTNYPEPRVDSIRAEKDRAMEKENRKLFGDGDAAGGAAATFGQKSMVVAAQAGEEDYDDGELIE